MGRETSRAQPVASIDAARAALVETLATEPDVIAAYLFGSLARGAAGPLSDIDVALLVADTRPSESALAHTMDGMCRRLRTSRVDVVSLAEAAIPLRYRVVRDGSIAVCRDAAALQRFVAATVLQYLDFKPLRDHAFGLMRKAILEDR